MLVKSLQINCIKAGDIILGFDGKIDIMRKLPRVAGTEVGKSGT